MVHKKKKKGRADIVEERYGEREDIRLELKMVGGVRKDGETSRIP